MSILIKALCSAHTPLATKRESEGTEQKGHKAGDKTPAAARPEASMEDTEASMCLLPQGINMYQLFCPELSMLFSHASFPPTLVVFAMITSYPH